jgi:homoserine kinase
MFGRKKKQSFDLRPVVAAAMSAFLAPEQPSENGRAEASPSRENGHGLGSMGAVAVGAALAVTARAAYSRARQKLDLEQVADAVEQRLGDRD